MERVPLPSVPMDRKLSFQTFFFTIPVFIYSFCVGKARIELNLFFYMSGNDFAGRDVLLRSRPSVNMLVDASLVIWMDGLKKTC